METIVLYHNPRCGKSRAALALLQERHIPVRIVEYLKEPLARQELAALCRKLGVAAAQWVRQGESEYKASGLGNDSSEAEILDAMAQHPILMERPIAVRGSRAVVGRPPERVLELLG